MAAGVVWSGTDTDGSGTLAAVVVSAFFFPFPLQFIMPAEMISTRAIRTEDGDNTDLLRFITGFFQSIASERR